MTKARFIQLTIENTGVREEVRDGRNIKCKN